MVKSDDISWESFSHRKILNFKVIKKIGDPDTSYSK
jgi:hypothetical protein